MDCGFLIDMDGVIYRGNQLIPGADRFITELMTRNIPFLFLTNNSQRTRRDVAVKLRRLGIDVSDDHIFTCAMATARFLAAQKPHGTAYASVKGVCGTPGITTGTRSSITTPTRSLWARVGRSTSKWLKTPFA